MADSPRTFLPKLHDDWTYGIVARHNASGDLAVTVTRDSDGDWRVNAEAGPVVDDTFATLREALAFTEAHIRKWETARKRLADAQAALAEFMPNPNVTTPGFGAAQAAMDEADHDAQPVPDDDGAVVAGPA